MRCINCGCESEEGKFCAYCGGEMYEVAHCIRCGREIAEGHELCVDCLSRPVKKKKSSKGLIAAVIVMILIIVSIAAIIVVPLAMDSCSTKQHELINDEEDDLEQEETESKEKGKKESGKEVEADGEIEDFEIEQPEEAEEIKDKPKKEKELAFDDVKVSSEYAYTDKNGVENAYYVENVTDDDYKTTWSPKRNDREPWIKFEFDEECIISKIMIENGYSKTEDLYYQNARAKDIRIECEGFSKEYTLEDSECGVEQFVGLEENIETKYVKITVLSTYEGEEINGVVYDDLCITEVDVYGF